MRRALVLLAVLVAVTVVGVRIADPSLTDDDDVSLSDRPAVVAGESLYTASGKVTAVGPE